MTVISPKRAIEYVTIGESQCPLEPTCHLRLRGGLLEQWHEARGEDCCGITTTIGRWFPVPDFAGTDEDDNMVPNNAQPWRAQP